MKQKMERTKTYGTHKGHVKKEICTYKHLH
jgi:hypothetical protein